MAYKTTICVLTYMLFLTIRLDTLSASNQSRVAEAVGLLESVSLSLKAYDVYVEVTRTWPLEAYSPDTERPKKGSRISWRDRSSGAPTETETVCYRLVVAEDGRRLVSCFSSDWNELRFTITTDSKRTLYVNERSANIRKPKRHILPMGHEFTIYRNALSSRPLHELARERQSVVELESKPCDSVLRFHVPPRAGTSLARFGFIVELDPEYSHNPTKIVRYKSDRRRTYSVTNASAFARVGKDVCIPTRIATSYSVTDVDSPVYGKTKLVVEVNTYLQKSSFNFKHDPATFSTQPPPNMRVVDFAQNVWYVTDVNGRPEQLNPLVTP